MYDVTEIPLRKQKELQSAVGCAIKILIMMLRFMQNAVFFIEL